MAEINSEDILLKKIAEHPEWKRMPNESSDEYSRRMFEINRKKGFEVKNSFHSERKPLSRVGCMDEEAEKKLIQDTIDRGKI